MRVGSLFSIAPLVEKTLFSSLNFLDTFIKNNNWLYRYQSISDFSVLSHWFTCLPLRHYHSIWSQYALKSRCMVVCLVLVHLETRQYSSLVVCWPVSCVTLQMHSLIFSRDSSRPLLRFLELFFWVSPSSLNTALLPAASATVPFNLLQLCLGSITCTASTMFLWTKTGAISVHFSCFPLLRNHSPELVVVQCLKIVI